MIDEYDIQISLPVSGMSCASCVSHVEQALSGLPGVQNVAVNLNANTASFSYDPDEVTIQQIRSTVSEIGYEVPTAEVNLKVTGMTCDPCTAHIEAALTDLPGVIHVSVNLKLENTAVTIIPGTVTISQMTQSIQEIGYGASEQDPVQIPPTPRKRWWR
jgi:P-type Cu+ transporter